MDVKRVLYITYDGLTDPLGQSQILPYIKGLSQFGYNFTILSFEKKERLQKEEALIRALTKESGIDWVPLSFTSKPPLLSKFYDAMRMKHRAIKLQKDKGFDMVHSRSYIAADVGLHLKQRFGIKFFFDMRGFWADEKKDGSWDVSNPLFNRIYKYYKKKEAEYLQHADCIISLTEAGKKEMQTWPSYNDHTPLQVIPCCADMELFSLTDEKQKTLSREKLGLKKDNLVISYLGSIGTWYMLDEMLQLFSVVKKRFRDAAFLFVTHSDHRIVQEKIKYYGLASEDFLILEANRKDVPQIVKASDLNISFIKPVYSKISSSPTKLGEVLSMGIPVICNSGIGDVEAIVNKADAGIVLHHFSEDDFEKAVNSIPYLVQRKPADIRNSVEDIYSLNKGIRLYKECYEKVIL